MRHLRRVFRKPDGTLAIVSPAWEDRLSGFGKTAHATEAAWYEWAVTNGQPAEWVSLGDIDTTTLPSREFRECWRHDGAAVVVDVALETQERWRRIRRERDRRLHASDSLMARANETGVKIAEWKTYRQTLRDIPQSQSDPKNILWPQAPA